MEVLKVSLQHEHRGWIMYADGQRRRIDNAGALRLAKALDKIDTEHIGLSYADVVRKQIRLDADALEEAAVTEQQRAEAAAEREAGSAFRARQRALAARADAERLAPLAD